MSNYSKHVSQNTPQTQPLFGRSNLFKNNAGGYVFKVTDEHLLERFLLIGSLGGTYYVSEQKLTVDNAEVIVDMIKNNGQAVLTKLEHFVNKAPKRDPSIFVLALCCTYGDEKTKRQAYSMIKDICVTSTHLFTFCSNIQDLRGWSRGLRKGVSNWYLSKTIDNVAYQAVKYRQRNGWTHRDVLRLAHPKAYSADLNDLFEYMVYKPHTCLHKLINAFDLSQLTKNKEELCSLIREYKLTWEMIPTQFLNEADVLKTLLPNMPMTAMIRNLNRMTNADLFKSNMSESTKLVVSKLTNSEQVKKAGLHPVNVLNSMATYSQGKGDKGALTWTPNQKIVDALHETFELSFNSIEPTNKNILVAVDVSGSMQGTRTHNMSLTARQIAAALSLTFVKTEPNVDLIWFDTQAYTTKVGKRTSYEEVIKNTPLSGGTDCSLPYKYALQTGNKYDAIIMLTDNETWAGDAHVVQLQQKYQHSNPNCKHIIVGMTVTEYSVLTDSDPNVLHCVGYDSSLPEVINSFIKG